MQKFIVLTVPHVSSTDMGDFFDGWTAIVVDTQSNSVELETGFYFGANMSTQLKAQQHGQMLASELLRANDNNADTAAPMSSASQDDDISISDLLNGIEFIAFETFQIAGTNEIYHSACGYNLMSHSVNGACPLTETMAMATLERNKKNNITETQLYLAVAKAQQ